MMKKVFVLLIAALFAGGIIFFGTESLFASTEEAAAEETLNEASRDSQNLESQIEEEEARENPGDERDLQGEEEKEYPDEKTQDERR